MSGGLRPLTSYLILGAAIVVFVASLASSVSRLYDIEQDIAGDAGENAVWTMTQNEVEVLLFLDSLSRFVEGDARMSRDGMLQRFDLLWSRLAVAQSGEVARRLEAVPGAPSAVERAQQALTELEPRVQALTPGARADARAIDERLRALLPALHQASVASWHAELEHYTDRRAVRQEALLEAIAYLLGLAVSMAVLVILLLLELRRRRLLAEQAGAAEQAARFNEARFRDVVEAASDWVWETDADHRLSFISERLRLLSGEEAEDVLGKTRRELRLANDEDDANWDQHQSMLDQRLPFRDFTIPYADVEGRRHWARIHGRPVFDAAGNFAGYRGTGRDITEERKAAEAIKESRALLRAVIDAVPAVINVKDRDSRYVLMNRFQGEVYGVGSEAAVGRRSEDFTGERYGQESRAFDREVIDTGRALPFRERDFVDAKGKSRVWWTAKQPLKDALGAVRYVVTVALDITSLKAMEKARNNLSRYFSPNMVEVLAAKDAPISQVRQQEVAVVFADLVDFTRLCANATPEQAMSILRDLHARMTDIVLAHGGTLEKFLGDGLMATFGTPKTSGRDAWNALSCAQAMAEAMQRWNGERRAEGEAALAIGIGAHFGTVILGDIGSDRRLEFAVVGDTVNVASRLEALTRELGAPVVVSQALIEAARRELPDVPLPEGLTPAGPQAIEGHDEPILVWTLAGQGAARPASAAGDPGPRAGLA